MLRALSNVLQSRGGATRALVAIAVPLSALALGGVHTPVLCVVTALLATAAFIAWYDATPARARLPATVLFVTGVALTAYTALQCIPLPASIVHALAPSTADVWDRALQPLREPGPAWTTLSLDPPSTRIQVLRGVAYVAAFLAALRIADEHGGTTFLVWLLIVTSLALGASAVLHPMFGAHRVWGVYTPVDGIQERHIAPLLNPNHLAAYLNIGFCLALATALNKKRERLRPIAAAVALLLAITVVWVASRGGVLALVFGATLTVLTTRVSRRFAVGTSAGVLIPFLAVCTGIGMTVLGAAQDVSVELGERDVSKLKVALEGLRLVPHHAVFGVGRGAFEVAFPAVRTDPGYFLVTHPENFVVQWVTEWGLPATIAAAIAIAYALRPKVLLVSASPALGAWAAIATVVAHNLVDFNSEVPAICVAAACCAGMILAGRGNTRPGRVHLWAMHPRAVAMGVAAAALVTIGVVAYGSPHELESDRRALYEDVTVPDPDNKFVDEARSALLHHPAEAYVPFIGAVDAGRRGRSVLPWVERTLELAPVYPPAHFVLAQQLAPLSPSQARLEYRYAMSQTRDETASRALTNALQLVRTYDDALEILPTDTKIRVETLINLAPHLEAALPSTRVRLDELLEKLAPGAHEPLLATAQDAIMDLDMGEAAPWCADRATCAQPALSAVDRLAALEPGTCTTSVLRARLLAAMGDAPRALHDLQAQAQNAADAVECWKWLGQLAVSTKSGDGFVDAAEDELSRTGCVEDADCANNLMWVAQLEEGRGNPRRAMRFYQRAHEHAPERVDIVFHVATIAVQHGMHAQALEADKTLLRMTGDKVWADAVEREKTAVYEEKIRHDVGGDAGAREGPGKGFSTGFEHPFDEGEQAP